MWVFEHRWELTGGVGKTKGDRAVWNITNVPHGHLTGVISKVLWTEVFQFQHLGLTLQTHTHSHDKNTPHKNICFSCQSKHAFIHNNKMMFVGHPLQTVPFTLLEFFFSHNFNHIFPPGASQC